MWNFKKTVLFVLSILPCMILVLIVVQGVFSEDLSLSSFTFGSVTFVETTDQITISYSSDSIAEAMLSGFFPSDYTVSSGTALYAFFHGYNMILNAIGFSTVSSIFIIASFYLLYYVAIYYIFLLVDFITIVPQLVERFFKL